MALRNEKLPQEIPAHLDRWNWGAFFLNWIWGIGNSTFIAFLMFVPLVNFVMPFVLGAKGSKWAWENRYWKDEEHFKSTQRKWAFGALALFIGIIIFVVGILFLVSSVMKNSDAHNITMDAIRKNPQVVEALGSPISSGFFPTGNISIKNNAGKADLVISLSGSKADGKAHVKATKQAGTWTIHVLYVVVEGRKTPIVLINKNNITIPGTGIGT